MKLFKMSKEKKAGSMFVFIAILLSLVAVGATYTAVNSLTRKEAMWIANQDIYAGDPLNPGMFNIVEIPVGGIPGDAVLPGADLSTFIAVKDMNEHETLRYPNIADLGESDLPLISSRLRSLDKEAIGNLDHESEQLHQLRAGEIPIDSVVGMMPGMKNRDKVSVTSVFFEEMPDGEKVQHTETIFDYVEVIAIRSSGDNNKGTLVLALTNRQFEALALAREKGKFYISLMAYGIKKPADHPEILSQLYTDWLDRPYESTMNVDYSYPSSYQSDNSAAVPAEAFSEN